MIILVVVNLRLRNLLKLFASTTRIPKERKFFDVSRRIYDLVTISKRFHILKVEYQESQERHRVEISRFFRAYGYSYSRV